MKNVVVFLLSYFFSILASAGGISDGGGQGVVCRNADGSVVSAQLLDLFEGTHYFNLKIDNSSQAYLQTARKYARILDKAIPSGNPTSKETTASGNSVQTSYGLSVSVMLNHHIESYFIEDTVLRIDSDKILIASNVAIPPTKDSNPRVLPTQKGCAIEQIAAYTDGTDKLRIIGPVWNKLNNVNKAALLIHEALYRALRLTGDNDSNRTRKVVGYLFANHPFQWVLEGLPSKFLSCWTTDVEASYRFLVVPSSDNKHAIIFFLVYDGEIMLSRTAIAVDIDPFAEQFGLSAKSSNLVILNKISNPLLNLPNYMFAYSKDESTGKLVAKIEAFARVAGTDGKTIVCNPHLHQIKYGPEMSVAIGPVSP